MDGGEAADLAIFISCTALLLGYSLLYFRVATFSVCGKKMMNLYALNKQTRKEWVVLLSQGEPPSPPRILGCAARASLQTLRGAFPPKHQ